MITKNITTSPELDTLLNFMSQVPEIVNITVSEPNDTLMLQISSSTYSYIETPTLFTLDLIRYGVTRTMRILIPRECWSQFMTDSDPTTMSLYSKETVISFYSNGFNNYYRFNYEYVKDVRFMFQDFSKTTGLGGGYILEPMPMDELDSNLITLINTIKNNDTRISKITAHLIVDQQLIAGSEDGVVALQATIPSTDPNSESDYIYYRYIQPSEFNNIIEHQKMSDIFKTGIDSLIANFMSN